jgi:hypothetical protein
LQDLRRKTDGRRYRTSAKLPLKRLAAKLCGAGNCNRAKPTRYLTLTAICHAQAARKQSGHADQKQREHVRLGYGCHESHGR